MRTDRELLELAAKAAGVGPVLCYESARNCLRVGDREGYKVWQPLTKDGEALRLAVALRLDVLHLSMVGEVMVESNDGEASAFEDCEADPLAATRRAIVRAAAEIGAAM